MKIETLLRFMADKGASDLFLATGAPPSIKVEGELIPISEKMLDKGVTELIADQLMNAAQRAEFSTELEMNLAVSVSGVGRFRVNIYRQRGEPSIVVRYIHMSVPSVTELGLPPILSDFVMMKTGLVLVVGATGSGKSTSLASMIEYRNANKSGHILTIEDPIEFAFKHRKSIISQREVGIDTLSYKNALREALREAPDVIMVGEIRDREAMEAALTLSDTGHLVLATLHAINANQALDRIINMFPHDYHPKLLQDMSLNLRAVVSQRLIRGLNSKRAPAVEILVNTPFIADLIADGNVNQLKEAMQKDSTSGMQTFDQSLLDLYERGVISRQQALDYADSANNMKWMMTYSNGMENEAVKMQPLTQETTDEEVPVVEQSGEFDLQFQPLSAPGKG